MRRLAQLLGMLTRASQRHTVRTAYVALPSEPAYPPPEPETVYLPPEPETAYLPPGSGDAGEGLRKVNQDIERSGNFQAATEDADDATQAFCMDQLGRGVKECPTVQIVNIPNEKPAALDKHPGVCEMPEAGWLEHRIEAGKVPASPQAAGRGACGGGSAESEAEIPICSICLDHLVEEATHLQELLVEEVTRLQEFLLKKVVVTDCNHRFHVGCLDRWQKKQLACPNCRAVVLM